MKLSSSCYFRPAHCPSPAVIEISLSESFASLHTVSLVRSASCCTRVAVTSVKDARYSMHDALAALLQRLAPSSAQTVDESTRLHVAETGTTLLLDWLTVGPASVVGAHVVDVALQFDARIGIAHANHGHKLVESCATRLAMAAVSCSCSQCGRTGEPGGATRFFRCAPCQFTLCEECFSMAPPVAQSLVSVDAVQFVSLLLRRLHVVNPSAFELLSPHIVVTASCRLQELPIHNAFAALPLVEIIVELFSFPGFAQLFISTQSTEWLPQPILGASVRMRSLLAVFLTGTSMSTSTSSLSFKPQWTTSYTALRDLHTQLFQHLLGSDTQSPYVVNATLAGVATLLACLVAAQDAGTRVDGIDDGILVNLSVALTNLALPIFASRRCSIQSIYHESLLPRRVYPWRPDTLRTLTAAQKTAIKNADQARLAQAEEKHGSYKKSRDDIYRPVTDRHYRVMCEQCEDREFAGIRYKCAFCDDFDFCGPCYQAFAQQCEEPDCSAPCHSRDHVFVRIASPVSVIGFLYIFAVEFDEQKLQYAPTASCDLVCTKCGIDLEPFDNVYRCCNCVSCRLVCPSCLADEERVTENQQAIQAHVPGHVYVVVPRHWRQRFDPRVSAMRFPQLVHPSCLIPPETFTMETEVIYLTMKTLHDGPVRVLSKLRGIVKEIEELQAFCACEEKRVAFEKSIGAKLSPHYAACRGRLSELKRNRAAIELHVLDEDNILHWLRFYTQAAHWICSFVSSTQNAFHDIIDDFSTTFTTMPEHFFFDVCELLLILPTMSPTGLAQVDIEPLLVLLVQLIASRSCSGNPHLRVLAMRALSAVVTVYFASPTSLNMLAQVFHRCAVLRKSIVDAIFQLHEDLEGYHVSNDGLLFADDVSPSQDRMLWGLVPIRVSVTLLLRALHQFNDQNLALSRAFSLRIDSSSPCDARLSFQVSLLITKQLTDAVKLFEEAEAKQSVLLQLADVRQKLQQGQPISLPFRPSMLEGYMALHSKQLRLSMRMLVEILELLTWMADTTPLRLGLFRSELFDQLTRTLSFLMARLSTRMGEPVTWHEQKDERRVLIQVISLVVRCAGRFRKSKNVKSLSNYWQLVHENGSSMLPLVGSLDFQVRFALSKAIGDRELAQCHVPEEEFDVSMNEDEEDDNETEPEEELEPVELISILVESMTGGEAASNQREKTRDAVRFALAFASDGRFHSQKFSAACEMLLRQSLPSLSALIKAFQNVLSQCEAVSQAQAVIDDRLADTPAHFLDPLLNTLMLDPVRLPSGTILDRVVIMSHVLSGNHTDPFTREPLTLDMVSPCHDLRHAIRSFLKSKLSVDAITPHIRSSG